MKIQNDEFSIDVEKWGKDGKEMKAEMCLQEFKIRDYWSNSPW